jgi:hypothetical protein
MNESVERRQISITRRNADGRVQTSIRTSVVTSAVADTDGSAYGDTSNEAQAHFDPDSCCDEREKALIASLREYLRPQMAPQCLLDRLNAALDRCCCEVPPSHDIDAF